MDTRLEQSLRLRAARTYLYTIMVALGGLLEDGAFLLFVLFWPALYWAQARMGGRRDLQKLSRGSAAATSLLTGVCILSILDRVEGYFFPVYRWRLVFDEKRAIHFGHMCLCTLSFFLTGAS